MCQKDKNNEKESIENFTFRCSYRNLNLIKNNLKLLILHRTTIRKRKEEETLKHKKKSISKKKEETKTWQRTMLNR